MNAVLRQLAATVGRRAALVGLVFALFVLLCSHATACPTQGGPFAFEGSSSSDCYSIGESSHNPPRPLAEDSVFSPRFSEGARRGAGSGADFSKVHTYFVAGKEGAPAVWVHNASLDPELLARAAARVRAGGRVKFANIFAGDAVRGAAEGLRIAELRVARGKWRLFSTAGEELFTAKGNYNFVTIEGRMYTTTRRYPLETVMGQSVRGQRAFGHIDLARGGLVEYAGQARFGTNRSTSGILQSWSNASGHYRPTRYLAEHGGFPTNLFEPVGGW